MRKYSKIIIRYFRCPDCNGVVTASKKSSMPTAIGHIKTMYCPFCKEEKDFFMFDSDEIKRMN